MSRLAPRRGPGSMSFRPVLLSPSLRPLPPPILPANLPERRESHMSHRSVSSKLALVGVLVSATSAWAQKPKYTRTQDIKVEVKLSERVKPIVPKDPKEQQQQQPE